MKKTRSSSFSPEAAAKAIRFIEALSHTKGKWAGVKFDLMDWQREGIVAPLFGTLNAAGKRSYRTAYIELPRKNGKTELAAAIALKLLVADGEQGAEVYSAAADRDQASLVFHVAAEMVRRHPRLSDRLRLIDSQKRIIDQQTGSFYRAIPADVKGSWGYNAHAVIADEVHAYGNRDLWDALTTSSATREQPLIFAITTAGFDRTSICYELHDYAEKVLAGVVVDPTFFAYIRKLPDDADWTDERNWAIANPGLDEFRSREELRTMVERAKATPALENTVRRLYFNQWTSADVRWFRLSDWDRCGGVLGDLSGQYCFGGLDMSSTTDFTAWVLFFPEGNKVLPRFFLPEAQLLQRSKMRSQLEAWAREGDLFITPGDAVDQEFVVRQILKDAATYHIREIGFDPWLAQQVAIRLTGEGLTCVPVRQGYSTLSEPSKWLSTLVAQGELNHGGHPVLRYNADNVMVETDADEHIKPSKKKSTDRIDGIAALVTALERAMHAEAVPAFISFG